MTPAEADARLAKLERTVFGAGDEGNVGVVARVLTLEVQKAEHARVAALEKPIKRIGWLIPFATALGTAIGIVLASTYGGTP